MKSLKTLTTLLTATLMLSMAAPTNPGPGMVIGRATTLDGKPLAGVKIWVKPVVTTGVYETKTDASGYYQAAGLPSVGYRVYGWYEKEYNGQRYCLRLGHKDEADYNPLVPTKGVVRNLVWLTEGRIPDVELYEDMGYFGGSISIMGTFDAKLRSNLEFTLTPTSPLIDGSKGKVLVRKPNEKGYLVDVPIGVYKVKATIAQNGSKKPIQIGSAAGSLEGEATLEFKSSGESCKGNYVGGGPRAYLYWNPQAVTANQPTNTANQPSNTNANQPKPSSGKILSGNSKSTWEGTVVVNGGDTYYVRYIFTVEQGSINGRGLQQSLWKAEFFECSSLYLNCEKLGWAQGVRMGDEISLVTMLSENNNSFATDGTFEGDTFSGTTNAVFEGQMAEVELKRVTDNW